MIRVLAFVFLLTFSSFTWANMYFPIPVGKQIKEAKAIVDVEFQKKQIQKNGDSKTGVYTFKMLGSAGLNASEIKTNYVIEVNQVIVDEDTIEPFFEKDERSIIFLEKKEGKYWFLNGAISKYTISRRGRTYFMISELFPYHPVIGQVPLDGFLDKVEDKFQQKFVYKSDEDKIKLNNQIKFSKKKKKLNSRTMANYEDEPIMMKKKNQISIYWLIFIMACLAIVNHLFLKRED